MDKADALRLVVDSGMVKTMSRSPASRFVALWPESRVNVFVCPVEGSASLSREGSLPTFWGLRVKGGGTVNWTR
jgi:hypothetical protein